MIATFMEACMKNDYLYQPLMTLPSTSLIGEVCIPAPNKHFRRTATDWILYLIKDGQMQLQEEHTLYTLRAGDVLLLAPGKTHFGIQSNYNVNYYFVHFQWDNCKILSLDDQQYRNKIILEQSFTLPSEADSNTTESLLFPKYIHLSNNTFSYEIINIMADLCQLYQTSHPYQQTYLNCMFLLLLIKICRYKIDSFFPTKLAGDFFPLAVISYLKNHYFEKITGERLEKEFHHNFDYMNRKFKGTIGCTIFSFLEQYRIQKSKTLLASGRFTLAEIAERTGYCNGFYFSKQFKKHEQISPREYQEQLLQSLGPFKE